MRCGIQTPGRSCGRWGSPTPAACVSARPATRASCRCGPRASACRASWPSSSTSCPRRRRSVTVMPTAVLASSGRGAGRAAAVRRIALIGNPNTGKTTLFNALCGARAKTSNFPGTTTSVRTGRSEAAGHCAARSARPARRLRPRRRHAGGAHRAQPCSAAGAARRPTPSSSSSTPATCRATSCWSASCSRAARGWCVALNMIDLAARRGLAIDAARVVAPPRRAGRADGGAHAASGLDALRAGAAARRDGAARRSAAGAAPRPKR